MRGIRRGLAGAPSMRWRACHLATMLACLAASSALSQTRGPAPPAPLLGIFDGTTGDPVAGVQVRDEFSGAYALTTATGTVRLSFITFRGAASFVRLMKLGYEPKTLFLAQSDTMPITEVLESVATLAPVVTTERYRLDRDDGRWNGFSRRCAAHTVTCFGDTVLASNAAANMADLLVKAQGVTVGACGTDKTRNSQCGRVAMRSSVIPPAYCEPSIFVDGFWWNPHITSPIDLQPDTPPAAPFTPSNVKGVEVYATNAPRPLRFEGDPFCGAIVVWTK